MLFVGIDCGLIVYCLVAGCCFDRWVWVFVLCLLFVLFSCYGRVVYLLFLMLWMLVAGCLLLD